MMSTFKQNSDMIPNQVPIRLCQSVMMIYRAVPDMWLSSDIPEDSYDPPTDALDESLIYVWVYRFRFL